MAYENVRNTVPGVTAAADLSTKQYFLVVGSATGVALAGNGALCLGVLQNKPDALGIPATVASVGSTSKCTAATAITQGDLIASDAAGKGVVAATGDHIVGVALDDAGADGELFTLFINNGGTVA